MRNVFVSVCLMVFLAMVIPEDRSSKDATFYFNRAELKREQKDFPAAYSDYTKAIKLDENFVKAYWKRGLLKIDMDSLKGAIADFDQVINKEPRDGLLQPGTRKI